MQIAIIGYGKMGHMIEEVALQRGHEVVVKINIENTEDFTKENISKADVAIEFTGPSTAYDNIKKCIDFGVPVVSGSTGWNSRLDEMKDYIKGKKGSFLHTSNFSIGVNIFFEVNKLLAKLMASHPEYDIALKESVITTGFVVSATIVLPVESSIRCENASCAKEKNTQHNNHFLYCICLLNGHFHLIQ